MTMRRSSMHQTQKASHLISDLFRLWARCWKGTDRLLHSLQESQNLDQMSSTDLNTENADAAPRMSAQQRQSSGPRMSSPTRGQRQSNFHFSTNRMSRPKSVDESAHHGAKTSPTKSEHGSRGTDVRVRLRASTGRPQSPNPFFPDYQESPRTERSVASRHRSEGYDGTEIYETRVQRGRMPERTSSRRGSYEHSASPPREWLPPSPRRGNDSKVLTDSPRGWEPHTSNPRELPDIERAPSFRAYSQAPTSRDDKQRGGYGSPSPPSLNDSSPGRQQASDEGSLFYPTFAPHHRHREPARTFVGRDLSEGWTIVQRQNTVRPLIQSPSPVAREEKPRSVWRPRQGMRIDNLREPGVVGLNHTLHKPPPRSQNSGVSNIGVSRSSSRGDTDGTASDFEREISDGPFLTMNEQRAQNMNQNPTAGSRGQNRRAPPRTFASRSPEESPLVISQVRNWPKKRTKRKTMEEVVRERMIDSPSMSLEISGCGRM